MDDRSADGRSASRICAIFCARDSLFIFCRFRYRRRQFYHFNAVRINRGVIFAAYELPLVQQHQPQFRIRSLLIPRNISELNPCLEAATVAAFTCFAINVPDTKTCLLKTNSFFSSVKCRYSLTMRRANLIAFSNAILLVIVQSRTNNYQLSTNNC